MKKLTTLTDRMLGVLAPKATAMASCLPAGCYYSGSRSSGPCHGGYIFEVKCNGEQGYASWWQCAC